MKNPYIYSLDNKRYQTWNYYLQQKYHHKVAKVPLDADFTCPNRDGKCGYGGCSFCSSYGSGEFITGIQDNLVQQFYTRLKVMQHKWPNCLAMAYFQAFSNTYAPVEHLKLIYEPFIENPDVLAICIATRADCIDEECLNYLSSINQRKDLWIELGLQSIHDETMSQLNRGHDYQCLKDIVDKLHALNINICVHLINGLPKETTEMMLETAKEIAKLPIQAVKIHMLHLIKGTLLASQMDPSSLLSREEYVDIVVKQLEVLPPNMIIERVTGDGMLESLIGPDWTIKKTIVINEIDKLMVKKDSWQGKYYQKER